MKYIKRYGKYIGCIGLILLSYNLYFIFLVDTPQIDLLVYLDFLVLIFLGGFIWLDYYHYHKKEKEIASYLQTDEFIGCELKGLEDKAVIEHDYDVFNQKINQQIEINTNLNDAISKWFHEIKLPLSAVLLMDQQIEDSNLQYKMNEQHQRMNRLLNDALVSCKVQGGFDDVAIHPSKLSEIVNASIKNNRFFLIHDGIDLSVDVSDEYIVYTDATWLVYILDQLLANAIKYANENPKIEIRATQTNKSIQLTIKDYGEGIKDEDLPRIFDRGFVGCNHHNGTYKSTGLGLYMVKVMADKLGHTISVSSHYHHDTTFMLTFSNIAHYFNC